MSTPACAHLHVHSEYSLLDGAAQDRRPRRPRGRLRPARARPHRPRCDERLGRALQGLQEARHQADPRPRGLLRRRPHGPRGQDRAQPPDAPRRHRRGLPQPHEALQRRLPRGPLPRQAGRRPRVPRAPRRGRHRVHRLPRLALLPPHRRGPRPAGPRARRPARPDLRPRGRLLRGPAQRDRRAGAGQRADREVRHGDGRPARRHRRRPLPPQGGLPPPRRAAVRADEVDARRSRR